MSKYCSAFLCNFHLHKTCACTAPQQRGSVSQSKVAISPQSCSITHKAGKVGPILCPQSVRWRHCDCGLCRDVVLKDVVLLKA